MFSSFVQLHYLGVQSSSLFKRDLNPLVDNYSSINVISGLLSSASKANVGYISRLLLLMPCHLIYT